MILLSNLMHGLAAVLDMVLNIAMILIIARVVVSWLSADPHNFLVRIINSSTEPMLRPFQRLPLRAGGIDFSPIVLLLAIVFLRAVLVQSLYDYARLIRPVVG